MKKKKISTFCATQGARKHRSCFDALNCTVTRQNMCRKDHNWTCTITHAQIKGWCNQIHYQCWNNYSGREDRMSQDGKGGGCIMNILYLWVHYCSAVFGYLHCARCFDLLLVLWAKQTMKLFRSMFTSPSFLKLETPSQLSPSQVNKGLRHLVYLLLHTLVLIRKDAKKTNRNKTAKQKATSARVRISLSEAVHFRPLWGPRMRNRVGLILFPRFSSLDLSF